MKKALALLLAAVMLLSLTACGGSAEPVETAPATTEAPTTAPTEAPTEEPTEAPAEPPTEPEPVVPVDPTTLPDPIRVEDQLTGEDTQTVTLGSLAEYEELLRELGFREITLNKTCEPVSLTYNAAAFRLDFRYRYAENNVEEDWYIYGTKANAIANVSKLKESGFAIQEIDTPQKAEQPDEDSPAFCYDRLKFCSKKSKIHVLRMVYFPFTGNLYNYLQDPENKGSSEDVVNSTGDTTAVGFKSSHMQFHIRNDSQNGENASAAWALPEDPEVPETLDIGVDKLLQGESAITLSKAENWEYVDILEEMGFAELLQPLKNNGTSVKENRVGWSEAFDIVSLTYNGEVFKMELAVKDSPPYIQTMYVYGAKSDTCGNMTTVSVGSYDSVEKKEFPWYTPTAQMRMNDLMRFHAWYAYDWLGKNNMRVFYAEMYYPKTGSLYNLVSKSARDEKVAFGVPNGLLPTAEQYMNGLLEEHGNVVKLG